MGISQTKQRDNLSKITSQVFKIFKAFTNEVVASKMTMSLAPMLEFKIKFACD